MRIQAVFSGVLMTLWLLALGACRTAEPLATLDVVGTWTLTDSANESFNVLVHPNGKCVSTWWKGDQQAAGEVGSWDVRGGALHLQWTNGWHDALEAVGPAIQTRSWAPGHNPNGAPDLVGRAVRVPHTQAPHAGVWLSVSSKPGAAVHLAIRSDGTAARSCKGVMQMGTWITRDDITTLIFADGVVHRLCEDGRGTREDVYAAGAAPDAKPTLSGSATRY